MKNLIKVAEELIDVLGLVEKDEEPIELDPNISKKDLVKFIKDGAKLIDPEGDDFSKETIESLKKMSLWPGEEEQDEDEEKPAKKGKKASKKEEETPDEEEDEDDDEDQDEEEKPAKKEKKPANKKPVEKPAKKPTKVASKSGKGVIATIVELVEKAGKKGISREMVHEKLVKEFPDRVSKSLLNTVKVQLPGRINKEKMELEEVEKGFWKVK